MRNHHIF